MMIYSFIWGTFIAKSYSRKFTTTIETEHETYDSSINSFLLLYLRFVLEWDFCEQSISQHSIE